MMTYARTTDEVRAAIDEMLRRIVDRLRPERVILFGSHANGTAGPDSDVDLVVVVRTESKCELTAEIHRLLAGVGVAKDVIIVTPEEFDRYGDVPGTIVWPAAHEGRVLHERAAGAA
jgi:predicted nucleotidyltransferase